ncbi:MAG: TolC family protein [Nitrospira sp.]|nr:TolC family protein [Nitrospira sp.]
MMQSQAIRLTMLAIGLFSCLWTGEGTAAGEAEAQAGPTTATSPALTWESAIGTGVTKHPLIEAAQHGVLETEAVTNRIASINYPQVSGILVGTGGNTRVLSNLGISGSLPKPTNPMATAGSRVDLLITDFGRTTHRILANKALAASAEKDVLMMKAWVILSVEQAYLNCLKQQRLVEITREVLTERQLIRSQAETLYRHQLRAKLDFDLAAVEAAKAELDFIKARNDLKAAYAALNAAMGIQGPDAYTLNEVQAAVTPAQPIEPLFKQALEKRPELLGSRDRVQAAEEALKAAQALNFGSISAIGTAGYSWWGHQEVVSVQGNPNNPNAQLGWWGVGVATSTPLYTGPRIQSQIDEADARKGEAQATARTIANDVILQVAKAYLSRLTAEQQIQVAQERVAHAREALTLARERYKAGLGSILDVTTATADLLAAQTGLAEAQYEYRAGDSALAYAIGSEYARY